MYQLIIAEKPSVPQSIAALLGPDQKDGCMEGNGYIVSWCFGHLAELSDASAYHADYAKWNMKDLPIIPQNFRFTIGVAHFLVLQRRRRKLQHILLSVVNHGNFASVRYSVFLCPLVVVWYILTEAGSIVENAGRLGAPVRKWLRRAIAVLRKTVDEGGESVRSPDT